DGTVLEENQPHPRGGFESPLPPEEIEAKFRANAKMALSEKTVETIIATLQRLEELPKVEELSALLSA
ncbi:MAG TPA: MmgE/PrpD family protein, partial [Candidatus Binatia bacterium]